MKDKSLPLFEAEEVEDGKVFVPEYRLDGELPIVQEPEIKVYFVPSEYGGGEGGCGCGFWEGLAIGLIIGG